ncbi:MAG: VWA domain-containing protein [Oleiphilaceae bacterium]|nr:VWA domain-containing protein [Oleiphilaceae bacterium]
MTEWLAQLSFLRPAWLLLLPVALLWLWWWRHHRDRRQGGDWHRVMDPRLLAPLMPQQTDPAGPRPGIWLPALILCLALLALSGPSWREAPRPSQQPADSLVVVMDLSLSMLARDLEPDRLTQAKRALQDLLRLREGLDTGLIAYAGDAHVVSPLTRDRASIEAFLPALDPFIMPSYGSRADRAVQRAIALLEHSAAGQRQILLITDGIRPPYREAIRQALSGHRIPLQILAVGSEQGAPIPLEDRGVIREDNGQPVIVSTELAPLRSLARAHGGQALRWTGSTTDLSPLGLDGRGARHHQSGEPGWRREDGGYWLLLLLLPLALWGWRRGHPALSGYSSVILPLAMAAILAVDAPPAMAGDASLWRTPDQQAMALLPESPGAASRRFRDRRWQALAHYRAGHYAAAEALWASEDSPEGHYNRGNALAQQGRIQEAIAAYETALALNPDMTPARENRQHLMDYLDQQQERDSQQQPGQDQNNRGSRQPPQTGGDPEQTLESSQPPSQPLSRPPQNPGDRQEQDDGPPGHGHAPRPRGTAGDEKASAPREASPEADSRGQSQAHEQWLRRIPDDSASLLRRKFERDYQQRQRQRAFRPQPEAEDQPLW